MSTPKAHLILMAGLPRSGKTTMALGLGFPIVCRDSIRLALHGEIYLQKAEPMVTRIEELMVEALDRAGHETITLDACHLNPHYRHRWVELGYSIEVIFQDATKQECIKRAALTNRGDIIPIIEQMADKYGIE